MEKIDKIKEKASGLAEKYGLDLLLLFGSQVSGKTHKKSDYDLGFVSKQYKNLRELVKMEYEISEILKVGKIDLVDLKKASPILMKSVTDNSILLYQKEPTLYARFKIYALKLFIEARRLFDLREAVIQKFILKHSPR